MQILAIDPGYERLGIAILKKDSNQNETLIFSECFKTSQKLFHPERLALIQEKIEQIILDYQPQVLAIETLFFSNNQKTALLVSEARGVIIAISKSAGLEVVEFGPTQIKNAITGYGKSDKNSVIKMVCNLIKIKNKIKYDDEYDAIAIGLTYFATKIKR